MIEDANDVFYLSDHYNHQKIRDYVKKNFLLEKIQFKEDKIFLKSFRSVIHYYLNVLNRHDLNYEVENHNLEKVYGNNYSLYRLR